VTPAKNDPASKDGHLIHARARIVHGSCATDVTKHLVHTFAFFKTKNLTFNWTSTLGSGPKLITFADSLFANALHQDFVDIRALTPVISQHKVFRTGACSIIVADSFFWTGLRRLVRRLRGLIFVLEKFGACAVLKDIAFLRTFALVVFQPLSFRTTAPSTLSPN
jgi:hypothetical protein